MLEPVAKLSSITAVENSLVLHRISSSQKRLRCIIRMLAAERKERRKSRSLTPSSALSVRREKPSSSAHAVAVERIGGARQRAGAQGHGVGLVIGVLESALHRA